MTLEIVDVVGNPCAPGTLVTVTESGVEGVLASGYVCDVGTVAFDAVQPGQTYEAAISGELVIPMSAGGGSHTTTFTANADGSETTVTFDTYDSPFRSAAGFLLEMRSRWRDGRGTWPRGLVGPQGPATTPIATCIGAAVSAPLAVVDQNLRTVLAALRFGSSQTDALLEGFAVDLLGSWGLRLPYETLANYSARLSVLLRRDRVTNPVIREYVEAYITSQSTVPLSTTGFAEDTSGSEDTAGGEDVLPAPAAGAGGTSNTVLAEGTSGGEDTGGAEDAATVPSSVPTVRVFDKRTDPTTSAAVPVTNPDGTHGVQRNQVCIYFVYTGYADTPTVTEPYAQDLEATLLACFVAAGTDIVWATNKPGTV